jgi:AcrR family transcriptional regulator
MNAPDLTQRPPRRASGWRIRRMERSAMSWDGLFSSPVSRLICFHKNSDPMNFPRTVTSEKKLKTLLTDRSVAYLLVRMTAVTTRGTKRDEILRVASRLFYEQGYHCTGIQQIIEEAGAAKGTFYASFKSKEDLGIAWLKARHQTWNGWLQEALARKRTPRTKILGAFEFLGNWMQDCDYRGCAFLNTLGETPQPESPLRLEIAQHKRDLHDLFRHFVADHYPDRSEADREQIATTIFLLFEGALVQMQNFRAHWPLQAALRQVESLL